MSGNNTVTQRRARLYRLLPKIILAVLIIALISVASYGYAHHILINRLAADKLDPIHIREVSNLRITIAVLGTALAGILVVLRLNYSLHDKRVNERARLMLDSSPLACTLWDRGLQMIDCSQESVALYGLSSKRELIDNFAALSPACQPCQQTYMNGACGSEVCPCNLSSTQKRREIIRKAFKDGYLRCNWTYQTLSGEPIPCELTLVRVEYKGDPIVAAYLRDLREQNALIEKLREADAHAQLMFDTTPLACSLWDRDINALTCNQEVVNLFGLSDKKDFKNKFFSLSPELQPSGEVSKDKAQEAIKNAFQDGYFHREWIHQTLQGEQIPCDVTLIRVMFRGNSVVAAYIRDLREQNAMIEKLHTVDELTQLMFDATPMSCSLWTSDIKFLDCNQEAVKLFGLSEKKQYKEKFFALSPENQPCGRSSREKSREIFAKALKDGYYHGSWIYRSLSGELIPSELTMVRVEHRGNPIVAVYIKDMRECMAALEAKHRAEENLRMALSVAAFRP